MTNIKWCDKFGKAGMNCTAKSPCYRDVDRDIDNGYVMMVEFGECNAQWLDFTFSNTPNDEPKDDFIVGTVIKQDDYTIIKSNERLPKNLYKQDVEIRLKVIPKVPMRDELVDDMQDGVAYHSYIVYDEDERRKPIALPWNDQWMITTFNKYKGKKVKITIEEILED